MVSSQNPSIKQGSVCTTEQLSSLEVSRNIEDNKTPTQNATTPEELSATSFGTHVVRKRQSNVENKVLKDTFKSLPSLDSLETKPASSSPNIKSTTPQTSKSTQLEVDVVTRIMVWLSDLLKRIEKYLLQSRENIQLPAKIKIRKRKSKSSGQESEDEDLTDEVSGQESLDPSTPKQEKLNPPPEGQVPAGQPR